MRILFHGPGTVAFRREQPIPMSTGVQPPNTTTIASLKNSYWITGNRGNLIHAEAPAKIFRRNERLSCYVNLARLHKRYGANFADRVKNQFDVVVLSMANFIREDHQDNGLAEAIFALDPATKVVVLGAGIQDKPDLKRLDPSIVKLIKAFNERSTVFGVRGTKTETWLHSNGFKNAVAIGCPSLFVYPNSILGMSFDIAPRERYKLMTAGHMRMPQLLGKAPNRRGLEFVHAFKGIEASYVFQDELLGYAAISDVPNTFDDATSEVSADIINSFFKNKLKLDINFAKYYYFNESGAWRQVCRQHDLFIGDRFHGGVAALQAKTPAVFLREDERVAELTDFFKLPSIGIEEFKALGVEGVIKKTLTPESLAQLKDNYRKRLQSFRQHMETAGLHFAIESVM